MTIGGVLSTLIFNSTVAFRRRQLAWQNSFVPGVSVLVSDVIAADQSRAASTGCTVQSIDTFDLYQPEQSTGAGVHSNVTLGTASARPAPTSSSTPAIARVSRAAVTTWGRRIPAGPSGTVLGGRNLV